MRFNSEYGWVIAISLFLLQMVKKLFIANAGHGVCLKKAGSEQ